MSLGDTIRVSPGRAVGLWSIQSSDLSLTLSDRGDVSLSGGNLLGSEQPRKLTLSLRGRGRGESLSALRRALLPFVRPEAGGLTLTYAGAAWTVHLPCIYVDGLDSLQLVLEAKAPTWRATVDTVSGAIEGVLALNTPTVITPEGTAASPPLFLMTFASGGSLTSIENNVAGVYDLAYVINFAGEQPPASTQLQVACARVIVVPGYYMNLLQPGSTFSSFRLVGGVENVLTISGANLTNVRYSYHPRFWSWEDADAV